MSQYYCGIDLRTRTSQLCLTDAKGNKVEEANLPNDLSQILGFLQPFGQNIQIGIESTINGYWIVDGLQDAGFDVKLGHTEDLNQLPIPDESDMYCKMILERINLLSEQIQYLDTYLKEQTVEDPYFRFLLGLPGMGNTLGMTIYYETGDIQRFDTAKHYASYAR